MHGYLSIQQLNSKVSGQFSHGVMQPFTVCPITQKKSLPLNGIQTTWTSSSMNHSCNSINLSSSNIQVNQGWQILTGKTGILTALRWGWMLSLSNQKLYYHLVPHEWTVFIMDRFCLCMQKQVLYLLLYLVLTVFRATIFVAQNYMQQQFNQGKDREDLWQGSIPKHSFVKLSSRGASPNVLLHVVHLSKVGAIPSPVCSCHESSCCPIGKSISSYSSKILHIIKLYQVRGHRQ